MSLSTNFCINPDVSTLFVKKTIPLRGSEIANSVPSAFKSKNPPVSPTKRHGMFKEFSNATYQLTPWATTKVMMLHVSWLYVLNTFIHKCIVVARLGWKVVVESPDQMASLTTTNIFCENAQVEEWADDLKALLMGTTGIGLGKLTTCFFSNCCGYAYAHKSVIPSKIPSVLRRMMGVLMPVCGLKSESHWPTGVNVNYYPNGYNEFFLITTLPLMFSQTCSTSVALGRWASPFW